MQEERERRHLQDWLTWPTWMHLMYEEADSQVPHQRSQARDDGPLRENGARNLLRVDGNHKEGKE